MAYMYVLIFAAAVVFQTPGFCESTYTEIPFEAPECSLIEYLEIGTMGLIECSFNENYLAVTWYHVKEKKPIFLYKDGVKSGDCYGSGKYDIYPNGSLLIRAVAAKDESVYTVSKAISSLELPESYDISVQTTATPATTIPTFDQCGYKFGDICVESTEHVIEVTCSIRDSLPAIYLSWPKRTQGQDYFLPSTYMNFTDNNATYKSRAAAKFSFEESSFLSLLVCQCSVEFDERRTLF
ncbi:uncharacterized protein [Apostichopus japonicus]|uniref:uncharacterized protein n=1 Tax=Stichopus japonicus TaxID=307972 RepID=UPI003AB64B89